MSTTATTATETWREARSNPEINDLVHEWKRRRRRECQDRLSAMLAALAEPGSKHGYRGVQLGGGRSLDRRYKVSITVRSRRYRLPRYFPDAEMAARSLAAHLIEQGVTTDDLRNSQRGG